MDECWEVDTWREDLNNVMKRRSRFYMKGIFIFTGVNKLIQHLPPNN